MVLKHALRVMEIQYAVTGFLKNFQVI